MLEGPDEDLARLNLEELFELPGLRISERVSLDHLESRKEFFDEKG